MAGWCGILLPKMALGTWSPDVHHHYSVSWKEILAVSCLCCTLDLCWLGRVCKPFQTAQQHFAVWEDRSVRKLLILSLSMKILEFCRVNRICLFPIHIKGVMIVMADGGSGVKPVVGVWSLDRRTFNWIAKGMPNWQIDLVATRVYKQLPRFISPCSDDQTWIKRSWLDMLVWFIERVHIWTDNIG